MNQGVNLSWFVLFHLVTKVVISLGFIIRHVAVATACVQLSILKKVVYLKRRETDRLSDKKTNKHPIHYLVTISRTVANNIFFNLLKKMELTLKIKVLLLFFVTSAELELILIYTKTKKVRQHTTIID